MQLKNVRIIFITIGIIGILFFASPTICVLVKPPVGQEFSELFILGPGHTLDYIPFNIKTGVTYLVYLGISNHLKSSSYYTSLVKMGNETEPLPNTSLGAPSSLPAMYEYKSFISDNKTWEAPLTFRINKITFDNQTSQLSDIIINGIRLSIHETSTWNSREEGYYYNLFIELWTFSPTLGFSQYHNRFVQIVLNMTE